MPSYRFCRPDDIPYLVRAVNECWDVYFPSAPTMTVGRFRAEMKTLDVWPSNSLIASSDDGPIAVLIGTKRAREVRVLRVGVRSDHLREGHGGHLLTSLSQKLAVLGPERLVAEVPLSVPGATDFVSASGYRWEAVFTDYVRHPAPVEPVPAELVIPVTVDELEDHGLLEISEGVAWERQRETLLNSKDELTGAAIATPERIEAFLLHRVSDDGSAIEIAALGGRESERRELFWRLLLRHLAGNTESSLCFRKLLEDELPSALLDELGFEPGEEYDLYSATATPA